MRLLYKIFFIINFIASTVNSTNLSRDFIDQNQFSLMVANTVNPYFSKPYTDTNPGTLYYSLQAQDGQIVYRPNHSLAHGMRQAYLAVDIVNHIKNIPADNLNLQTKDFLKWILDKLCMTSKSKTHNSVSAKIQAQSVKFLQKLEFANAFQRSGRKSELSRSVNAEKYNEYLSADENNLQECAINYTGPGQLFSGQGEINNFKTAITNKFENMPQGGDPDIYFLSKIFYTAHLLDLRRIPHFDKHEILENIAQQLFSTNLSSNKFEQTLLDQLWSRAGSYLHATGDRDLDDNSKKDWNTNLFINQAHNPQLMIRALREVRMRPQEKLFESILHHVHVIRQIKENSKNVQDTSDSNSFHQSLISAPYTASEGYLKILLGKNYTEIPNNANEMDVRDITLKNIQLFLAQKHKSLGTHIIERISNPDNQYLNVLTDCMMAERSNRNKVVLYHATEPEMGLIFDIFTQLRNQLIMAGGESVGILRAIDQAFIDLNEYVQQSGQDKIKTATVSDFMQKYKNVSDDNTDYRDMVLSTNFGLFGSDQQINADTYNMFYEVKNRKVATQHLIYEKFIDFIAQKTGIQLNYKAFEAIAAQHARLSDPKTADRNGRLIQIFLDPKALLDTTYLSVLLGNPVVRCENDVEQNVGIDDVIKVLRNDPTTLHNFLSNTSGSSQMNAVLPPQHRRYTIQLHDLQARLFMQPEVMLNANLVKMISYDRFNADGENSKNYINQLQNLIDQDLVAWLTKGSPSHPNAFAPETFKLKNFVRLIFKNIMGIDAPTALPLTLENQFVDLLLNNQKTQAAAMLKDYHADLRQSMFDLQVDRTGLECGKLTLQGLLSRYWSRDLIQIAFDTGIFPGGIKGYQFTVSFPDHKISDAIDQINKLGSFEKALHLFEKYYAHKNLLSDDKLRILGGLNAIGYDESIVEMAQGFSVLLNDNFIEKILDALHSVLEPERQQVYEQALLFVEKICSSNNGVHNDLMGLALNFPKLLVFIQNTIDQDETQKGSLWEFSAQTDISWDSKIEVMHHLKKIKWRQDQYWVTDHSPMLRPISVPFDNYSVVNFTKQSAKHYNMEFLNSEVGMALMTEIIKNLNNGLVPDRQTHPELSLAYNRGNPEADYNKSLIAFVTGQLAN